MNSERNPEQIGQEPQPPKTEKREESAGNESDEPAIRDLEAEQAGARQQDEAKIAEVRASLGLEQVSQVKQILQECLDATEGAVERLELLKAKDLPENYQAELKALDDERLDGITIAVVPDDLWRKDKQPSESIAENQLILIKQSYFEARENPDEIAWLCHELSHCQNFLDSESPEEYQNNRRKFAFGDLKTKYAYPNNLAERHAFTKQFQYLKEQGKSRQDVLEMLGNYYTKEDSPFFNRLLDDVYGE